MRNLNTAANTAALKVIKILKPNGAPLPEGQQVKAIIAEAIRVDRRLIQASICEAANDKTLTDTQFIRKVAEILDIDGNFDGINKDWVIKSTEAAND